MSEQEDKKIPIHSTDKALIESAKTGKGLVTLTPELLRKIGDGLNERRAYIEERFPKLVEEADYETRLAITAWVMKHIVEHAKEGGSFRYLIYERLGFEADAYTPLYLAGGMDISNEFDLSGGEDK